MYLACSWTWCIALFLPAILVADVGPGAWLVFAICNIAGVMAMPFVVGSRERSLAFVRRNGTACRVFSVVTILCQAWFLGWAASRLAWPVALVAAGGVAFLVAVRADRSWQAAALVVMLATLAVFAVYLWRAPDVHLLTSLRDEFGWHPVALYAVPLIAAGFVFSPYLDLTFHHAMQEAPRAAFTVAFPILFGTMLLFSLAYRDDLVRIMLAPAGVAPVWLVPVLAVLILQVGFTLVLHTRFLPPRNGIGIGLAIVAATAFAFVLGDTVVPTGRTLNEFVYRASIGFYGVLTPCWVWAAAFTDARPGMVAVGLASAALLVAALPMLFVPGWLALYPAALVLMGLTRPLARLRPFLR